MFEQVRREQEAREQELKRRLMENNIYAGGKMPG
jgi:hypothetical protein